ncbi:phosphatase PAP2 family protein [Afifella pfennigii]|uniref:phosphatase PAP2 family protein n=1 Tax=Afifella pfennigii TaxID=209897 RepID=UPI00068E35F9|nr:phosphatase PAP2 family protein [Afifella pfennigii]
MIRPTEGWNEAARSTFRRGRERAFHVSRFVARRRRDERLKPLQVTPLTVFNLAILLASLLLLVFVLADPYLVAFQANMQPEVRGFLVFVTDLGKSDWMLFAAGGFLVFQLFRDVSFYGLRQRAAILRASAAAAYVFVAVGATGLLALVLKYGIGRARPRHFEAEGVAAFHPFSTEASWASFPSGHATNVAALAMALALLFPKARIAVLVFAFWIAVSRLATRSHYPTDVIAGFILGCAGAWLTARLFAKWRLVFRLDRDGRLRRRRIAESDRI